LGLARSVFLIFSGPLSGPIKTSATSSIPSLAGYPAGYLLFWETGADSTARTIGQGNHHAAPSLAIVDGQQRLTSLFAVVKGREVLRADFKRERIRIAFNPLVETFEVTDASIVKDKAYISDISALWAQDVVVHRFSTAFLATYPRPLDEKEKDRVLDAISRLHALSPMSPSTANCCTRSG
jgi:hypothetical protein